MLQSNNNFEEIPLPVFSDGGGYNSIIEQPSSSYNQRRLLPVSVIDVESSQTSCFTPIHGLDFLRGQSSFVIQQTVELGDLLRADEQSENRFNIKIPRGDTIYTASESSTGCQRTCFGSSRSYIMKVYDRSQQAAMEFRRRLACGACNFWFYLQKMEVWANPSEYVGCIEQKMGLTKTRFDVLDRYSEVIYNIEGPDSFCCLFGGNENFNVYNSDGSTQVGSIIHRWDQVENSYNIAVQTPATTNNRHTALLLGAAFLLEYMYYENIKKPRLRCIC